MLTSYVAALPHPYGYTLFNAIWFGLDKKSDEEGIDKDYSYFMEGIHWIPKVSLRC